MRSRDLEALELDKILEALAQHAASSAGRERCRSLRPAMDVHEVEARLVTLTEYLRFTDEHAHGPQLDVPDLRPLLALAAHEGAALGGRELSAVLATLRLADATRRHIRRAGDDAPALQALATRLISPTDLARAIAGAVDDSGHIRDEASPALGEIRGSARSLRDDIEARLGRLLTESGPDVVAEEYVTLRRDRFVVPLRAAAAHRIHGVIQDRSASGETIFVEPLFAVEHNNRLVLFRKAEELEERRICTALTAEVARCQATLAATFDTLVECDVLAARAALARRMDACIPRVGAAVIELRRARHPLLVLADRRAVPIDLLLGAERRGLVISGPNTGGKTVALKTLGLLALMAQCGLAIPAADDSALPCFTGIYADIGDRQSIEQNLSTFASHMTNLAAITSRAGARSLVLLDEPGVGTDPTEGGALAVALLDFLRERGMFVAASSHAADVKTFALADAGFEVAAVDVDPASGAPRYQLSYRTLGQSLALPMARRLGMPEPVLDAAARRLSGDAGPEVARASERLEETRRAYEAKLADLEAERRALAAREAEHAELVARLRAKQRSAWQDALAEAQRFVRELQAEGHQVLADLRRRDEDAAALKETIARQQAAIAAAAQEHATPAAAATPMPAVGDEVEVVDQGIRGELVEIAGERARIRRGALRFEVPAMALRRIGPAASRQRPPRDARTPDATVHYDVDTAPAADDLSLIGLRAREAVATLDTFMDRAMRSGQTTVRIIHGVGTGALRRAVQEYLADSPYCASFRDGTPAEGGAGVTVAALAL
jgi:DNA mismatch repair protein MutS2